MEFIGGRINHDNLSEAPGPGVIKITEDDSDHDYSFYDFFHVCSSQVLMGQPN